eukprot:11340357-Heterocapsa_arctica.AAC.1
MGGDLGRGSDGARDGVLVPIPEDERSLVLADSYFGRSMAAVMTPPEVPPTVPAASTAPITTAATMVDLKDWL